MAAPANEQSEAYHDYSGLEVDERILNDSQYNMVEFAKKYFREAVRGSRLDSLSKAAWDFADKTFIIKFG